MIYIIFNEVYYSIKVTVNSKKNLEFHHAVYGLTKLTEVLNPNRHSWRDSTSDHGDTRHCRALPD